jgi:hypothetical protein
MASQWLLPLGLLAVACSSSLAGPWLEAAREGQAWPGGRVKRGPAVPPSSGVPTVPGSRWLFLHGGSTFGRLFLTRPFLRHWQQGPAARGHKRVLARPGTWLYSSPFLPRWRSGLNSGVLHRPSSRRTRRSTADCLLASILELAKWVRCAGRRAGREAGREAGRGASQRCLAPGPPGSWLALCAASIQPVVHYGHNKDPTQGISDC